MAGVCAHMCRMARDHFCAGDACMRDTCARAGISAGRGGGWNRAERGREGAYTEAGELLREQDAGVAAGKLGGPKQHGPRHRHAHELALDLSELRSAGQGE